MLESAGAPPLRGNEERVVVMLSRCKHNYVAHDWLSCASASPQLGRESAVRQQWRN
jgi:hypothetical protein